MNRPIRKLIDYPELLLERSGSDNETVVHVCLLLSNFTPIQKYRGIQVNIP